jgi:glycosyltransferase involved in cell wall biosynthesis
LPQTLAHLAAQIVPSATPWEVIVVDNASTDGTAEAVADAWPAEAPQCVRIVVEHQLGLTHARYRGLAEAQYELISFVDDDNWVCPSWIQTVSDIMAAHPDVGACGGYTEAVCETPPPAWLEAFDLPGVRRSDTPTSSETNAHRSVKPFRRSFFALGSQGQQDGDITSSRGRLWGAGLTVRRSAWLGLIAEGFESTLVGRQGNTLSAGEDTELCLALRLAGWRLWYSSELKLQHFLPAERLTWEYLRRLSRGYGAVTVATDAYHFAARGLPAGRRQRLRRTWVWQCCNATRNILRHAPKLWTLDSTSLQGNPDVLHVEHCLGRLRGLLHDRSAYNARIRAIHSAPWRAQGGTP